MTPEVGSRSPHQRPTGLQLTFLTQALDHGVAVRARVEAESKKQVPARETWLERVGLLVLGELCLGAPDKPVPSRRRQVWTPRSRPLS